MNTATKSSVVSRLGTVVGVTAVGLAGVIGVTKVVNVNDPGRVIRYEIESTNITQALVTKTTTSGGAEFLVGSERDGPKLFGGRTGRSRGDKKFVRITGKTTALPGETTTVVVIAKISDRDTTDAASIKCRVTDGEHTSSHKNHREVECALSVVPK